MAGRLLGKFLGEDKKEADRMYEQEVNGLKGNSLPRFPTVHRTRNMLS